MISQIVIMTVHKLIIAALSLKIAKFLLNFCNFVSCSSVYVYVCTYICWQFIMFITPPLPLMGALMAFTEEKKKTIKPLYAS